MFKEMAVFFGSDSLGSNERKSFLFFSILSENQRKKRLNDIKAFVSFLFYLLCGRSRAHPYRQNHADIFSVKHDLDVIFL